MNYDFHFSLSKFCLNNQIYISINLFPFADLRSVVNWFLKQQEKHFTTNLSPWVVLKSGSITYCFDSWFLSWNNYTTKWKGEMKAISLPYIITIYIYYSIYYYLVFILIFTLLSLSRKIILWVKPAIIISSTTFRWGRFVSLHPYPVILGCILITSLCSLGFLKFRFVHYAD